jgi:hypothetical protein
VSNVSEVAGAEKKGRGVADQDHGDSVKPEE